MNEKNKKKEYVVPKADLVIFADQDIITISSGETLDWNEEGTEGF